MTLAVTVAAMAVVAALAWRGGSNTIPGAAATCERGTLAGEVTRVRDGDTIEVAGVPIRLNGLAAPERSDPGGAEAAAAMRELVAGRELRCQLYGGATYDRCVGTCYLDGADIAATLIRAGVARDCPRYSNGRYAVPEREAAAQGATIAETYSLPGYCRGR